MRYASPSTAERLRPLQAQGCDRILLVPLYPQYAAATTATACDQAFRALMRMRWQPAVRVAPRLLRRIPAYIEAIAASVRSHLGHARLRARAPSSPPFHGMPQAYLEAGDPYHCQCQKTSRLVRETTRLAGRPLAHHFPVAASATIPGCSPTPIDTVARLAQSRARSASPW